QPDAPATRIVLSRGNRHDIFLLAILHLHVLTAILGKARHFGRRSRANFSLFYDGPADTWMQGLDIGAIVHWTGQYEDDNISLTGSPKAQMPRTGGPGDNAAPFPFRARKVEDWTTLDLIASYTFNLPPPAMVANRLS